MCWRRYHREIGFTKPKAGSGSMETNTQSDTEKVLIVSGFSKL